MEGYNFFWDIIGDGPQLNDLKQKCNELDLEKKVNFHGNIIDDETKDRFIKRADVFLMPTLAENFGYNILEARVMGMEVCVSEKTTPWDCEFDQLYNCEHVQFLKLDKELWVSKLPRKRSCSLICNDANLVEKLSTDRKSKLNQFLESIQE